MSALIKEWVEKAEADFATANREILAVDPANYDAVCFHAQQCIEKLMKALLLRRNTIPPKTHDLAYLASLLEEAGEPLSWPSHELHYISRAAVEYRYPGESADLQEARQTLDICRRLRENLRSLLNL